MCGRFTFTHPQPSIVPVDYGLDLPVDFAGSYNFAPGQMIPALRFSLKQDLVFVNPRWGLIPSWAQGNTSGTPLINVRLESAARKPSFRESWNRRRCLILADGYFEWPKGVEGYSAKSREPYFISLAENRVFAMAGLWNPIPTSIVEHVQDVQVSSCAILTTTARQDMQWLHHRMPVLMDPSAGLAWLHGENPVGFLGRLETSLVSSYVNNVAHNGPRCIEPSPSLFD